MTIGSLYTGPGLPIVIALLVTGFWWLDRVNVRNHAKSLAFYRRYERNELMARFKLNLNAHDEGMGDSLPVDEKTGRLTPHGAVYLRNRGISQNDWSQDKDLQWSLNG